MCYVRMIRVDPSLTFRRDLVRAYEDRRFSDILNRLGLCQECYADGTRGVVFGCDSCRKRLAREVMET